MRHALPSLPAWLACGALLMASPAARTQSGDLTLPQKAVAGAALTVQTSGSGPATLYIVGTGAALRRQVQLGDAVSFAAGDLDIAGHYVAFLEHGGATDVGEFDVIPAAQPATLAFLAKPSRLSVDLHDGVSGAVYIFDAYHNLVLRPLPVSFQLSVPGGSTESRTVQSHDGAAWTQMNSSSREGAAKFVATAGNASSTRVIEQVPGDPCGLKMSAQPDGQKIALSTDPIRDCSGNPVPDGTIVTFTESFDGEQTTVDVPVKKDIAQAEVPAHAGARITVATGVVLGNEIRWAR
ncbi:MAG TPA: hypothetical protein VHU89_11155 [Acidobacteriaceae bacterium]|jgi:hypothetical protein|nr:hypothetical protein [Acidobacteriaceae bacterium]